MAVFLAKKHEPYGIIARLNGADNIVGIGTPGEWE